MLYPINLIFCEQQCLFCDFLLKRNYPVPENWFLQNEAKVLNFKWRTKKDKINCGLYAMLHMELYEFDDEDWDIGIFDEEDPRHRIQMDVLRNRYITKILLHEINKHQRKMFDSAKDWISEYPDEFEEEGTEAKKSRIYEEDSLKYNLPLSEIKERQKDELYNNMLLSEIKKMGHYLKECKHRRKYAYKKICSVDCEEVDQKQTSFLLTLDDGTKHKLLGHELHYLGFEEWKEFMLCIHKCRSLNADMKRKAINAVQKLLTKAKIMNEISVDEAYQSYIGLMPFKDPENQKFFFKICKEVLHGDEQVPDGVIFEDLKYCKEPTEGLCFLTKDGKPSFQSSSNVTNLRLLDMVVFYKLCVTEQNAPFKERVLRALHFQKKALSKHPEFYKVMRDAMNYQINNLEVIMFLLIGNFFFYYYYFFLIYFPDVILNFQKHQSSERDGNNVKLLYLTDGNDMIDDELADLNNFAESPQDQNKTVFNYSVT